MLSAPFVSKALAADKSLSIVQWAHFVPAYDTWFDKFAKDWGEKNKIAVTVDHIPVQNIPARAAAEASAGSGHDLFGFNGSGGAHLYRKFFIDVADLVKETEKKYGKVTTIGKQLGYNADDGTWSAFPDFYINFPGMYQKSHVGRDRDEAGYVGQSAHRRRQAEGERQPGRHLARPQQRPEHERGAACCGATVLSVQDEAGKKIVLDSKEAVEAVKYVAALYKEAMTSDVLSWNDASNNQYIDSGVGSYIINPISAYRTAQTLNKKLADDIFVIEPPKGPVKQIMGAASEFYGIWKFAKNKEAAIEFLRYYSAIGRKHSRRARGTTIRASPVLCPSRCRSCRTIRPRLRTTSCRSCRTRTSGPPSRAIRDRPRPRWTRSTTRSSSTT